MVASIPHFIPWRFEGISELRLVYGEAELRSLHSQRRLGKRDRGMLNEELTS